MNIIKQIASRGLIYVLAVAILGTGFIMAGDSNAVEAEKLSTVYLTNKATGLTTEASPPSTRTAPASRKNASTVYVTMSDVNTANAVKNSHIIDANKVVQLTRLTITLRLLLSQLYLTLQQQLTMMQEKLSLPLV